jgi:UDP-3-O-[3-hydroxymyristoyl] glucosamine N-acyltransferase
VGAQFPLGRIAQALGATLGETRMRRGGKIVNRAMLAGQVGLANHVTVGAGAVLVAKSGVPIDAPAGEIWDGIPSRPAGEVGRIWTSEMLLPDLIRTFHAREKRVGELEGWRHA